MSRPNQPNKVFFEVRLANAAVNAADSIIVACIKLAERRERRALNHLNRRLELAEGLHRMADVCSEKADRIETEENLAFDEMTRRVKHTITGLRALKSR